MMEEETAKETELAKTKEIWKKADAVLFDVDYTVIQEQSIHELAMFCQRENSVLKLCSEGITKLIPYQKVLGDSLGLLQPSQDQLRAFNQAHRLNLSPKVKELISLLHKKGVHVYLVTGSFKCLLGSIAKELGVPEENIFANKLIFFYNGEFAGFVEGEPTLQTNAKVIVADMLKKTYGYKNLVIIGDGLADLEACPPSDAFIGYGGNLVRDSVKEAAKWYVTDFRELIAEL